MARILIVDDSSVMRRNLKAILTKAGHEIVGEAVNGKQAIALYEEYKPDLVTMDITMPIMTGVEAVKEILKKDAEARIVMVSALSQKKMVFDALNYGAKHYIIKPIESEHVLGVVSEVLDDRKEAAVEEKDEKVKDEIKPGFNIENISGTFVVHFNEYLSEKDYITLDTAIRGVLFIKPLKVVFDFGDIEKISDDAVEYIINQGKKIKEAGGSINILSKIKLLEEKAVF